MKKKPDAILVIPFFNEALYLDKFLSNLKKQTNPNQIKFFCLFVDNNSTDKSVSIIKKYCQQQKIPFQIVNENRQGTVYSRISGIKTALTFNPELIISTDVDVTLPTNFISQTILDLKLSSADVLSGKLNKDPQIKNFTKLNSVKIYNLKQSIWNIEYSLFGPYFFGAYFAIKSSFLKKMKDLNAEIHEPYLGEDIFLSRRCYYLAGKFIRSSLAVIPHPRREILTSKENDHSFAGNMIKSHQQLYQKDQFTISPLDSQQENNIMKKLEQEAAQRLIWLSVDAFLFWQKDKEKHSQAHQCFKKSCNFFKLSEKNFDLNQSQQEIFDHIYSENKNKIIKKLTTELNQNL